MMFKIELVPKSVIYVIFILQKLRGKRHFNRRGVNIQLDSYEIMFVKLLEDGMQRV
jgi:hypothetical protein